MSDQVRLLTSAGNDAFEAYLRELADSPTLVPPWQLLTDSVHSAAADFYAVVERAPGGTEFKHRFEFG